jgi:DNA gyrase subunit B
MTHRPVNLNGRREVYNSESIVVLSGVEAIRKRPALYIGDTGADGLHRLVFELIENAVDEYLAGSCRRISVTLHEDGSCSVSDDGRGIPVSRHPVWNSPTIEVLLTQLHSGAKFSDSAYCYSSGLHGLGLTCVNALSKKLLVEVRREGLAYRQEYTQGVPRSRLEASGAALGSGTEIRFAPDPELFASCGFSYDRIAARLRELAFLNQGLVTRVEDLSEGRAADFCFSTGIRGLLEENNRSRTPLHAEPIYGSAIHDGWRVEVALQWTSSYATELLSYVNGIPTAGGGTHVEGCQQAMLGVLRTYVHEFFGFSQEELVLADVLEGMTGVVSIRVRGAEFDSQAKTRLVKREAVTVVQSVVAEVLRRCLAASPQTKHTVVRKIADSRHARLASRAGPRQPYLHPGTDRSLEVYREQFGIRSKNWHESCRWLTDPSLLNAHTQMCDVPTSGRLLDVCCGSGIVGASFGNRVAHKVGLDITPEMRCLASTRLDEVREGSVYNIPFAEGSFDLVVTREVIHLLPEAHRPLKEILRVLRPNGQVILGQTVPYGAADAYWMFRIFHKKQPLFCNNFMAEDLMDLFAAVGFERIKKTEYFLWESIDLWIDSHEATALHRQEIRELYHNAPKDVREAHPFEIGTDGKIRDQWRWCILSARKSA